jgi:hypothetical protein
MTMQNLYWSHHREREKAASGSGEEAETSLQGSTQTYTIPVCPFLARQQSTNDY